MKQRVMIAMALACEPGVLIADEPTTALDVTIQAQILELMRDIQNSTGMGILLITHDLGVVAENADVVAVMYAGKIVEYADVYELFRSSRCIRIPRGLLTCVPRLGERREDAAGRLFTIPGMVPSRDEISGRDAGLPRAALNAKAIVRKKEEQSQPELREVKAGHWVATWSAAGYDQAQATEPRLAFRRKANQHGPQS